MTVDADYALVRHQLTAGQSDYAISFDYLDRAEVAATVVDIAGVPRSLSPGVDFSVVPQGPAYDGGTLALLTPQIAGGTLSIVRATVPHQRYTAPPAAKGVEAALDRLALHQQEQMVAFTRTFRTPDHEAPITPLPTAAARAGRGLSFDSAGSPIPAEKIDDEINAGIDKVARLDEVAIDTTIAKTARLDEFGINNAIAQVANLQMKDIGTTVAGGGLVTEPLSIVDGSGSVIGAGVVTETLGA